MALIQDDLVDLVGGWAALEYGDGRSAEGQIAELTPTALKLSPMVVGIRSVVQISDQAIYIPLDRVQSVRRFERSLSEELIAEANAAHAERQMQQGKLAAPLPKGNYV